MCADAVVCWCLIAIANFPIILFGIKPFGVVAQDEEYPARLDLLSNLCDTVSCAVRGRPSASTQDDRDCKRSTRLRDRSIPPRDTTNNDTVFHTPPPDPPQNPIQTRTHSHKPRDQPPIMTMLRFRMDFKRSIPACFGFLFPTAIEMTSISRSLTSSLGSRERMTSRSETSVLSNRQTWEARQRRSSVSEWCKRGFGNAGDRPSSAHQP